jgi:small-conductance mechanosensitive channel
MMILASIVARVAKKAILRHSDGANAEKIAKLIRDLVYYILLGFGVFVAFEVLGFDVGLLLG